MSPLVFLPMYKFLLPLFALAILLTGCVSTSEPPQEEIIEEPEIIEDVVKEEPPIRETKDVQYTGIVRPAGISIYQEGSHRLLLPDGRFILLESKTADLNGYVNEEVDITGALRPTVEAGGMIMRVETISLLDSPEPEIAVVDAEEESADDSDDIDSPTNEEVVAEEDNQPIESEESAGEPVEPQEEDKDEEEVVEVEKEVEPRPVISEALQERINLMSKQNYSADQWTQEYCTAHKEFCFPVHRNWWYKSFGATSSALWHVEVSTSEIFDLWEGPIRIELFPAGVGSKQASDKEVRSEGTTLVGYRNWLDNTHFEISGDPSLEEAIRYITDMIGEYKE